VKARHLKNMLKGFGSLACALILSALAGLAHANAYDDFIRAAKFDDVQTVDDLLQHGIDPNSIEENRGESMLMIACRENANKVVDLLLAQKEIKIEARAKNGDNALMLASHAGNLQAVQKLLDAGAEVNQPGWTALHYAADNGSLEVISLLLEHSAYIDAESPNKTTPLMMAVRSGKIYAVKLLLDEGADINLKNDKGLSALDFARVYEQKTIEEGLLYRLSKLAK
jgi:ankyrin repeat protein